MSADRDRKIEEAKIRKQLDRKNAKLSAASTELARLRGVLKAKDRLLRLTKKRRASGSEGAPPSPSSAPSTPRASPSRKAAVESRALRKAREESRRALAVKDEQMARLQRELSIVRRALQRREEAMSGEGRGDGNSELLKEVAEARQTQHELALQLAAEQQARAEASARGDEAVREVEQLRKERESLLSDVKLLRDQLEVEQASGDEMQSELAEMNKQRDLMLEYIKELTDSLAAAGEDGKENGELTASVASLTSQLSAAEDSAKARAEHLTRVSDKLAAVEEEKAAAVEKVKQLRAKLDAADDTLRQRNRQLSALTADLEEERAALLQLRASNGQLRARVMTLEDELTAEAAHAQEERAALGEARDALDTEVHVLRGRAKKKQAVIDSMRQTEAAMRAELADTLRELEATVRERNRLRRAVELASVGGIVSPGGGSGAAAFTAGAGDLHAELLRSEEQKRSLQKMMLQQLAEKDSEIESLRDQLLQFAHSHSLASADVGMRIVDDGMDVDSVDGDGGADGDDGVVDDDGGGYHHRHWDSDIEEEEVGADEDGSEAGEHVEDAGSVKDKAAGRSRRGRTRDAVVGDGDDDDDDDDDDESGRVGRIAIAIVDDIDDDDDDGDDDGDGRDDHLHLHHPLNDASVAERQWTLEELASM